MRHRWGCISLAAFGLIAIFAAIGFILELNGAQ